MRVSGGLSGHIFRKINYIAGFAAITSFFNPNVLKAQFSVGNVVVLQVGDGNSTLVNTGNPLIFKEYNSSGSLTYSVTVPSTGSNAMVLRGNATSEGYISRSADGNYIVFGAYLQALPNTSVLNTSAASAINRGIGLINSSGAFNIGASSTSLYSANDIRGAAATNSANLWASGSGQGSNYFGTASTATTVQNSKTNLRASHIFNGQLYCSSQVTTAATSPTDIGVYAVGSGTPNTSAQTVTTVINAGSGAQPGQFFFNSSGTICYVADARVPSSGGGVQKWILSAGTWSLAYTLPTGTASAGAFGVVADFSGLTPMVYATSTESSLNRLVAISDAGASSTATTLATAGTNAIFRGLAFAPGSSTCVPASIVNISNNAPVCSSQDLVFNANTAGSSPISYTWSGQGAFSSNAVANPSITGSATGAYTLTVSNACGTASASVNVSINPSPTLLVNAASICAGGVATITATGANTYTWNNGSNVPTFTASPSTTTNYTISGTSSNGCAANSVTTSISIISSPSLSVNNPTTCAGVNTTVYVSGASTYTWSNNSNSVSIVVNPTATSVYTVSANASGCAQSVSITATVNVNPIPVISFSTNPAFPCYPANKTLTLVPSPAGGVFTGSLVSGTTFSAPATGTYSVSYNYTNSATTCSNSATQALVIPVCAGLDELKSGSTLNIYPNPAGDRLNIALSSGGPEKLIVYDAAARQVLEAICEGGSALLDISSLSPGIYFIRSASGSTFSKFVKE